MGFRLPALRIAATRAERSRPEVVAARMPASAEFAERVFKLMTQEANLESEKKSASIDPEVV